MLKLATGRNGFALALIGNGIAAFANWIILVIIARLGTPIMLGQYTVSLAIAQPIFLLTSFNLGGVLMTEARREYHFIDYLSLRMFMTGIGFSALLLVCRGAHFDLQTRRIIVINGVGIALDSVSQLIYGLMALHSRLERVTGSLVLKSLLSLAGIILGLSWTHDIVWAVIGSALASALVVVCYDLPGAWTTVKPGRVTLHQFREAGRQATRHHFRNIGQIRRLMGLAAPMGITVTLISLTTNIPRLLLESHLGVKELGLFAAPASFATAGRVIGLALDQATRSRLARHYAEGDARAFSGLLNRMLLSGAALSAAILLAAAILGQIGLRVLFAKAYAENPGLLLISLAAGGIGLLASIYFNALSAARQFWVQVPCMLGVVAVTFWTCSMLIPARGAIGAATANMIAMIVQLVIGALITHNLVRSMPLQTDPS